jgi:amino acid transporter
LKALFRKKSIERILNDASLFDKQNPELKRNLGLLDLTAMGIAAIIGAGIFSTIGNAASSGGPAVSLLFVFTAIACGFSGMCYARFASIIPISGSAYTYAYASFGELIAWIIGWDLIMEYAVGNIAVAISWSDYFTGLCGGLGIHIPSYLSVDYLSAVRGFGEVCKQISAGNMISNMSSSLQEAYYAYISAPQLFGIRIIIDLPAFLIVAFISTLVFVGIRESKIAGNLIVLLKIGILLMVIFVGFFYVNPGNWNPFAPHGISGVMKGVAAVFFAYIGFDAISTTAEECKNPKKDLPKAMILSLIICTILYVIVSFILTGLAPYQELAVGDPLAYVFSRNNLNGFSGIISFGAIIAMAGVLLVFQIGQPRIWMSMSRDGLLPKRFSKINRKYKTPGFATVIAGLLVAIPALFMNLTEVTDLTSIGTLFAFSLVSAGVLIIDKNGKKNYKGFKIPYLNARIYLPILWIGILILIGFYKPLGYDNFNFFTDNRDALFNSEMIPFTIFIIVAFILSMAGIIYKWSIIPLLGLLTNLYLMSQLGITNWLRFLIWLIVGLIIYFLFGYKKSKLAS